MVSDGPSYKFVEGPSKGRALEDPKWVANLLRVSLNSHFQATNGVVRWPIREGPKNVYPKLKFIYEHKIDTNLMIYLS